MRTRFLPHPQTVKTRQRVKLHPWGKRGRGWTSGRRPRTFGRKGRPDGNFHPKFSFMTSLVSTKNAELVGSALPPCTISTRNALFVQNVVALCTACTKNAYSVLNVITLCTFSSNIAHRTRVVLLQYIVVRFLTWNALSLYIICTISTCSASSLQEIQKIGSIVR
jgi:hypothetical protein